MRITQDIRDFAEQKNMEVEQAIEEGLAEKAREFRDTGGSVF
jgi:phosphomethylpyrimidine synthase